MGRQHDRASVRSRSRVVLLSIVLAAACAAVALGVPQPWWTQPPTGAQRVVSVASGVVALVLIGRPAVAAHAIALLRAGCARGGKR